MQRISNALTRLVAFALFFLTVFPWAHSQTGDHAFALKTSPGAIFTGHISAEAELGLKGRASICLRVAAIRPNLDSLRGPMEGFFVKAGPKFYLNGDGATTMSGWAMKPELLFGHYRDWEAVNRGGVGNRWVMSWGIFYNLHRSFLLKDFLVIDPFVGVGYVGAFEKFLVQDDTSPNVVYETSWRLVESPYREAYEHSQFTLGGTLSITGGVLLGLKF